MAYHKKRKPRKETTAQSLARYKRQQERQRKQREARRAYEQAALAPGGLKNPLQPKWCKFSEYPKICLRSQQERYRGRTEWVAYLKGHEPDEHSCAMTGHKKRIEVTRDEWESHMNFVGNVRFGNRWYRHPITSVSYQEFCNRYVVYEEHSKYLD